ncbi:MAG: Ig domain-containing protein, partial [Gemmatimonadaceae bacterium]|nr:Ig domain-containing protein [Gemmatimonadaceae bacterium]
MRASRLVVPLVLIASGLAFLSCGGDGNGPTGGVPTVQISPDTDSLEIGATTTLQATVRDANGAPVQNAQVFWNTENPQIATVSDQGVVTAVGLGTVRIAASSQGRSALASITVIPKPVASVTVKPSSWTLTVGQTVHLQATPLDANGTALSGRVVTWSSNNASVAAVDETGFVSALAPGSATITATSEGKSGTATITVNLPSAASVSLDKTSVTITVGQTAQLTATVKDANGATINGAPVTWTSSAPGVASVSASGLVTGVSTGAATI